MFPRRGPGPGSYELHHHAEVLPWLFFLVLVALVVVAVLVLLRQRREAAAPASLAGPDPALAELRARYARGEIDREEYLVRSADLGGPPTP
jgi:uncharacterized membrane protein